jgi:predicted acetyltransferase
MILRKLDISDENAFNKALHSFTNTDSFSFVHPKIMEDAKSFLEILRRIQALETGPLPEGFVTDTMLFAFLKSGEIIGRVSIRHRLNDFLARAGGHIGYGVLPQYRQRGYATRILTESIEFCKNELKLKRVLLTCDDDNIGSIKTIEKNGGVLEDLHQGPSLRVPKRRYWITL